MGFQMELNMGIPERAILAAIEHLAEKDKFTYADIAAAIPCSYPTIGRHMPKLVKSGRVKRTGKKRTGYRYEVVKEVLGK